MNARAQTHKVIKGRLLLLYLQATESTHDPLFYKIFFWELHSAWKHVCKPYSYEYLRRRMIPYFTSFLPLWASSFFFENYTVHKRVNPTHMSIFFFFENYTVHERTRVNHTLTSIFEN